MVIPDTYCWVDSESGATEFIPFLIWQYYPKWFWKAGSEKVKVVRFGWFNLYHMWNFEEIRIWRSQVLILPVYPAIPKMVLGNQDKVRWPSPIWLVQIAYKLVFQGDSESEEGNLYFSKLKWIILVNYSIKWFIEKYKFPSSDSESPWKTSLYAIWTSQIRDGHLTLSWFPHTILGIAGYTGRIRTWDLHILISSKFCIHMVQVEPSKSDNFDFFTASFPKPFWVVLPN